LRAGRGDDITEFAPKLGAVLSYSFLVAVKAVVAAVLAYL